ncbi:MAG: DUF3800 domain-containing protein [Ferruginibacter sp.]
MGEAYNRKAICLYLIMPGLYIFCDESVQRGKYYSNFYGGLLIAREQFERVNTALRNKVLDLGMEGSEVKWQHTSEFTLSRYKLLLDTFFAFVAEDLIKIRVMFTDNRVIVHDLEQEHRENQYHILYYYFIKHAFGLKHIISDLPIDVEVFFDKLPDKKVKNDKFKSFIHGITYLPEFVESPIVIRKDSIYEVDSKDHILMQCIDVVLGAMAFRLNDLHKVIPEGKRRRGKRTVAKENLYKHIYRHISNIKPYFNIGISTGVDGDNTNRLFHKYRHWLFIPKTQNKTWLNTKK